MLVVLLFNVICYLYSSVEKPAHNAVGHFSCYIDMTDIRLSLKDLFVATAAFFKNRFPSMGLDVKACLN